MSKSNQWISVRSVVCIEYENSISIKSLITCVWFFGLSKAWNRKNQTPKTWFKWLTTQKTKQTPWRLIMWRRMSDSRERKKSCLKWNYRSRDVQKHMGVQLLGGPTKSQLLWKQEQIVSHTNTQTSARSRKKQHRTIEWQSMVYSGSGI